MFPEPDFDTPKDAEEEWYQRHLTTELHIPELDRGFFDFRSDWRSADFGVTDSLQFGSDSPLALTPPGFFSSARPPGHERTGSQPGAMSPPARVIHTQPVGRTTPKGLSFTKRSLGPRQISGAVDQEFLQMCLDTAIAFNRHRLGFIPSNIWTDSDVRFGDLVTDFFQRKNNAHSRFSHRLFNAARITRYDPFYFGYIGVEWISRDVLKVDKRIFAQLLGIKSVDGSLFHQQGNFPSHGFVEIGQPEALQFVGEAELEGVDFEVIRLLVHQQRIFTRDASEDAITNCTWVHAKNRLPVLPPTYLL
jgi:hypothetical protein